MPLLLLFMGLLSKLNLESLLCQLCTLSNGSMTSVTTNLTRTSLAATLKSRPYQPSPRAGSSPAEAFESHFVSFAFCSRSTAEACGAHWALSALVRSAARCDVFAKGHHCFLNRPLLHISPFSFAAPSGCTRSDWPVKIDAKGAEVRTTDVWQLRRRVRGGNLDTKFGADGFLPDGAVFDVCFSANVTVRWETIDRLPIVAGYISERACGTDSANVKEK